MKQATTWAFTVWLVAVMNGCAYYPRNGDSISNANGTRFAGLVPFPGATVNFWMLNYSTNQFDVITQTAQSATSPVRTDSAGQPWYAYDATIFVPIDTIHWRTHSGNNQWAYMRTTLGSNTLTTFEPNADSCLQSNANLPGLQLASACASPSSPDVRLIMPPGQYRALCRPDNTCDGFLRCSKGQCF